MRAPWHLLHGLQAARWPTLQCRMSMKAIILAQRTEFFVWARERHSHVIRKPDSCVPEKDLKSRERGVQNDLSESQANLCQPDGRLMEVSRCGRENCRSVRHGRVCVSRREVDTTAGTASLHGPTVRVTTDHRPRCTAGAVRDARYL
jgi:hypothetical protein